jgi:hypothetical protein
MSNATIGTARRRIPPLKTQEGPGAHRDERKSHGFAQFHRFAKLRSWDV